MPATVRVVPTVVATEFEMLLRDYLSDRKAQGMSVKTIKLYRDAIEGVLLPYCADRQITQPEALDARVMNDLTGGLLDGTLSRSGKPLSKATVSLYSRAINTFLAWTAREAGRKSPARAKVPHQRKRALDTLSRLEISTIEAAAGNERDKLIVRLLGDTGIRLGELLALTAGDIDVIHGTHVIRVLGKGDRERLVPLTPQLFRRLQRFAARVAPKEQLFRARRRSHRTGEYEPLTQSAVEHMLKDVAERAGITKRVYPHLLRHSFVTNYLRAGGNPILAAQIVGHTSLAMIQNTYQHLVIGDAAAELMRLMRMDPEA